MELVLKHGLKYGDELQTAVTLKELTTGDLLEAQLSAEKLVFDGNGNPSLVNSPALFGYELLRRQIGKIGVLNGPISLAQLKQLHLEDIDHINIYLETMESAKAQRVLERGRLDATGGEA